MIRFNGPNTLKDWLDLVKRSAELAQFRSILNETGLEKPSDGIDHDISALIPNKKFFDDNQITITHDPYYIGETGKDIMIREASTIADVAENLKKYAIIYSVTIQARSSSDDWSKYDYSLVIRGVLREQ